MDLDKKKFQAAEITKITGVKRTRLQQWIERGFIIPSVQVASGPGTRNIYNIVDIYNIAIFKKITEAGFSRKTVDALLKSGNNQIFPETKHLINDVLFLLFVRKEDAVGSTIIFKSKDMVSPMVLDMEFIIENINKGINDIHAIYANFNDAEWLKKEYGFEKMNVDINSFDDIYIVNFAKIKNTIDQKNQGLIDIDFFYTFKAISRDF